MPGPRTREAVFDKTAGQPFWTHRAIAYIREQVGGPAPPQSQPHPTITFEDRYAFELGGVRFELIATPGGETTDSMVVWLPQHRICFAGNLFSALFGHFPSGRR